MHRIYKLLKNQFLNCTPSPSPLQIATLLGNIWRHFNFNGSDYTKCCNTWLKNCKNKMVSDSYMVCNFSAGLESENIYALYDKSTLVSHLGVKIYRTWKIGTPSILKRNKGMGRMKPIILKLNTNQICTVRNCMINVSILNLEHQCHIKSGWQFTYLVGFIVINN